MYCDLEQARASNGTMCGRLYQFVTDVFSQWLLWTQRSVKAEVTNLTMKLSATRASISSFVGIELVPPEATYTMVAAVAVEFPTWNSQ